MKSGVLKKTMEQQVNRRQVFSWRNCSYATLFPGGDTGVGVLLPRFSGFVSLGVQYG